MNGKDRTIPDFIVVGAGKAGTTSIHKYLTLHPEVCMPVKEKELGFWYLHGHENEAHFKHNSHLPNTYEKYKSYFEHKEEGQLCGEVTPAYFSLHEDMIENLKAIHSNWKDIRIIISLREPIDKLWSHYRFVRGLKTFDKEELNLPQSLIREEARLYDLNFHKGLAYVFDAMYYKRVKDFLETFPHVKILLFDELKSSPQVVMDEITDFLRIGKLHLTEQDQKVHNASKNILAPTRLFSFMESSGLLKIMPGRIENALRNRLVKEEIIEEDTMRLLKAKFEPDIEKLNALIEKDLSPWLSKYKRLSEELDSKR